ncbi:hypothetical protein [Neobacillus sp. LXY-4]|uniref:hypothetical protein n=1 Tax=Neobacillus sp. LXY-4 TaxID=3379826 RepID=UPI003EDFEEBB
MKKIILSILLGSTLFGMGGAVLANTLDVEQRTSIESNVQQMVDRCKEFMGVKTDDPSGMTCEMQGTTTETGAPYELTTPGSAEPDHCLTEGADKDKVID